MAYLACKNLPESRNRLIVVVRKESKSKLVMEKAACLFQEVKQDKQVYRIYL